MQNFMKIVLRMHIWNVGHLPLFVRPSITTSQVENTYINVDKAENENSAIGNHAEFVLVSSSTICINNVADA
jgi:hypothetical protein